MGGVSMPKYFVNGHWYTDLGRLIAINDLLNTMKDCCNELNKMHNPTIKQMIKVSHARGFKLDFKLKPKK
jgi:hypothetical protein